MRENETRWPNNDLKTKYTDEHVLEFKQNSQNSHTVCNIVETPLEIDFTRFSCWTRLLATVTRVFEAIYIWKKKIYTPLECLLQAEKNNFQIKSIIFY